MSATVPLVENRSAWIVEWCLAPRESRIGEHELRPYILPFRWKSERVLDFMRCLFWNSGLRTPSGTFRGVNESRPSSKNAVSIGRTYEGPRLGYGVHGEGSSLIAGKVRDLCIARDHSGEFILKYTWPAGAHYNVKRGFVEPVGCPIEKKWAWNRKMPFWRDLDVDRNLPEK